jgi:cell division protein FtsQ
MSGGGFARTIAWGISLTLIALPIVGVLNGWFAANRWPLRHLAVHGSFEHVSAEQIRAAAGAHLRGGFFATDLDEVRDAVARLPWIARVEARKRWPDTVELRVFEQQPYARWGTDRLVNRRGELFGAPGAEAIQGLPQLDGPDDRLADVLGFHAEVDPLFAGSGLQVAAVALSPRGSWRIGLSNAATIEIGREQARQRLQRFLAVWPQLVAGRAGAVPASVDLRYTNGFALRWAVAESAPGAESRASGAQVRPQPAMRLARSAVEARHFRTFPPESRIPALP